MRGLEPGGYRGEVTPKIRNFRLATSRWIVHEWHVDAAGKGVRLVLRVDEPTVTVGKSQKTQPYLGMGRASFRLLDSHRNKGKKNKTDA